MTQSKPVVLVCGNVFDGVSEGFSGSRETLVQDGKIAEVAEEVSHPPDAGVVDLSERTVMPDPIDTHVHLTTNASDLTQQTLQSSAAKALKGLNLAQEYMSYGFATLRDLGSTDAQFPTVDLRNALKAGLADGPRLVVAAHVISPSGGHGDVRDRQVPAGTVEAAHVADGAAPTPMTSTRVSATTSPTPKANKTASPWCSPVRHGP